MSTHLLAIDLGAESGRGVLGAFERERLVCREIHRFPNGGVRILEREYWDIFRIAAEVKVAVGKAVEAASGERLASIGVDSWAVDFGLVGRSGELIGGVHHYRDSRTEGVMERVFSVVPAAEIYRLTGVQFLPFNTIYQLVALKEAEPRLLAAADTLLMVGELITYFLTGERVAEFTNATTTQLFEAEAKRWSERLFTALDLPREIMPAVVPAGTRVGPLLRAVAEETGAHGAAVVLPAVHDTGSAVAAVPGEGENWAYISSGTWSLVGLELPEAILTEESRSLNISNEGGVFGTYRFLKNVMGLWLIQECRRAWQREGYDEDYAALARLAQEAEPLVAHIDPDDPRFFRPGEMPARILAYLKERGQPLPASRGALVRCILESLALKYRYVLEQLQKASGRSVDVIHIVGGGARNELLNQMTADATGCTVIAGPYEATAVGNLIVQGIGLGLIEDLKAARALVRRSFPVATYAPQRSAAWDEAYARFCELIQGRAVES